MMMNRPPVFQQPIAREPKVEEAKVAENKDAPVQEASSNMVAVLENSSNPKHRNSELLKFLNKLNTGALKIEGEQLVEDATKMQEYEEKEVMRLAKEAERQVEEEKFRQEQEAHIAKLREQDDVDEI